MVVLVVDDSAMMRQLVRLALRAVGDVTVIEADDGAAALTTLDDMVPDLVLADLNMPNVDGLALVAAMRARPATRDIPFVLVTTANARPAADRVVGLGIAGYLTKPIQPDDVVSTVLRWRR
jgi:two-component system, chemotaxis family, chemotaxis protein CheY